MIRTPGTEIRTWFWIDDRLWIYALVGRNYEPQTRSLLVPAIDLDAISKIVTSTNDDEQTESVRAYRKTLRRRR